MIKKLILPIVLLLNIAPAYPQASGNANYSSGYQSGISIPQSNIDVSFESGHDVLISVKGLNNVKADAYVATFSATHLGASAEDVNRQMDERIAMVKKGLETVADVSIFVDMVTFVPVYEYDVEKKMFSKKTMIEVPKGFELKKNLIISFKNASVLDKLISVCASAEIYDLVKVDYICTGMEERKKELVEKAKLRVKEKMKNYQELIGIDLTPLEKDVVDGFSVYYPIEMYQSYQAYSSSSFQSKKSSYVNTADKSTTLYYQPIVDKEFDFVINPIVLEPVIQILYEVKIKVRRPEKTKKEIQLITPTGELKNIVLDK